MFEFIKEYIKHPFTIGAVAPSSKTLAENMMKPIHFDTCKCIVEYGPGTGSFTREIISRKRKDTKFLMIEQNQNFYEGLQKEYAGLPGVEIIHGSAEEVEKYLKDRKIETVDYVVSGLPFTSLPGEVSNRILESTVHVIGKHGKFITFQYSMVKRRLFERYFMIKGRIRVKRNVPPANVLVMQNR